MCYTRIMSKREDKKMAKRLEILTKSMHLFEEKGFDNVTVQEIANECGIAKKTLFQYISSKEELVFDNEGELLELIIKVLKEIPADKIWETYKNWLLNTSANNEKEVFFNLPAIIEESDILRRRLLEMWHTYEQELTKFLNEENTFSLLSSEILAARMVLALRLLFAKKYEVNEILNQI